MVAADDSIRTQEHWPTTGLYLVCHRERRAVRLPLPKTTRLPVDVHATTGRSRDRRRIELLSLTVLLAVIDRSHPERSEGSLSLRQFQQPRLESDPSSLRFSG